MKLQQVFRMAGLGAYWLSPLLGWLSMDSVECRHCVAPMLRYHFALLGFLVLGGFLVSLGQPDADERPANSPPLPRPVLGYRGDIQAWTLFLAPIVVLLIFLGSFNWKLAFL